MKRREFLGALGAASTIPVLGNVEASLPSRESVVSMIGREAPAGNHFLTPEMVWKEGAHLLNEKMKAFR